MKEKKSNKAMERKTKDKNREKNEIYTTAMNKEVTKMKRRSRRRRGSLK